MLMNLAKVLRGAEFRRHTPLTVGRGSIDYQIGVECRSAPRVGAGEGSRPHVDDIAGREIAKGAEDAMREDQRVTLPV